MRLALIIKRISLLHVLCCVVLLSNYAYANDSVVVIVNKHSAIDTLNAQQIRNLYMGDSRHSPQGEKITVINQRQLTPEKKQFFAQLIQKKPSQYHAYWARLLFTGKAVPPRELENNIEVIEYVAANKNALAYTHSALVDDRVKVIYRLSRE